METSMLVANLRQIFSIPFIYMGRIPYLENPLYRDSGVVMEPCLNELSLYRIVFFVLASEQAYRIVSEWSAPNPLYALQFKKRLKNSVNNRCGKKRYRCSGSKEPSFSSEGSMTPTTKIITALRGC